MTGWERQRPYVELSAEDIAERLAPAFERPRVAAFSRLDGGLSNTNYRVTLEDREQTLVLRIYQRQPRIPRLESDVHKRVEGTVPTAPLYYSDARGQAGGRPYAVFGWVDGPTLRDVMATGDVESIARAGRAVGRTLAALSKIRFGDPGLLGPDLKLVRRFRGIMRHSLAFVGQCLDRGRAGRRLGDELRRGIRGLLKANAELLRDVDPRYALVHGDFRGTNLIMRPGDPDWAVAAVLDWEFARAGMTLVDIGTLLRRRPGSHPALSPAFEQGFREAGGWLPAEWRAVSQILDVVNLVDLIDRPEDRPIAYDAVRDLLTEIVETWGQHAN